MSLLAEPLPSFPSSLWAELGKVLAGVFGETTHSKSKKPTMDPPGKIPDGIYLMPVPQKRCSPIN